MTVGRTPEGEPRALKPRYWNVIMEYEGEWVS